MNNDFGLRKAGVVGVQIFRHLRSINEVTCFSSSDAFSVLSGIHR